MISNTQHTTGHQNVGSCLSYFFVFHRNLHLIDKLSLVHVFLVRKKNVGISERSVLPDVSMSDS